MSVVVYTRVLILTYTSNEISEIIDAKMTDTSQTFHKLKLSPWILRQCGELALSKPTPIQENCIPHVMAGKDVIGCSPTGTGKTLCFVLPILDKLCQDPYGIFALILTPTRELAKQIADQILFLGRPMNLRLCVVTGGVDMVEQAKELANQPHVVVATPGRLADHLESCNTFSFKNLKFLVLDEADQLLYGTFDHQIKTIFRALPKKRQTLLFSATMSDGMEQARRVASNEVFLYGMESRGDSVPLEKLKQFYVFCPGHARDGYLVELVQKYRKSSPKSLIIIFTASASQCQVLSTTFNELGFDNVAIHGKLQQKRRTVALSQFKSSVSKILLATDVASRGLDIPAVELIINHMLPLVPKDYVHRVGRTARAGRGGTSVSLVTPNELQRLELIEEFIKLKLKKYDVDDKQVVKILTQVKVTKRQAEIALDESDFFEKDLINKRKKAILNGEDESDNESL